MDRELGRAISRVTKDSAKTASRAYVHDPAAAPIFEKWQDRFDAVDGTEIVYLHDLSEGLQSLVLKVALAQDAC